MGNKNLPRTFKNLKEIYSINLYDKILELRKFEIENFWKRTLFFWGTIAIVLAGYFGSKVDEKYLIFISLIGLLYNIIFSLSIRGSKYWQEHWETMAVIYENELDFDLFKSETSYLIYKNSKHFITTPYRFSVSKLTMLLSDLTVILWFLLWLKDLFNSFDKKFIFFQFEYCAKPHFFTIYVIIVHILLIGYFRYSIREGKVIHN
ncbi:hypothetical protein SAMN02927916_2552 [Flavobacterium anhuiense]|uniref:Uncharacterized protein n=1 Tax=Flavobacterium anhuiense TaxID=459526 RepID=A0ABY0LSG5_9FLAO|nr:hypothetical protein [Flavobacterium anhuiense]SCY60612.1 hypothetical protein SAMN02927916_2552 [Flavobacterium anhuiense]